jgi:ketosteroid isomerase-like protein
MPRISWRNSNKGDYMNTMTAGAVVRRVYEAFGKADVPAILAQVADKVDWEFVGPPSLAYSGRRKTRAEVEAFFGLVAGADDIHAFEPREFIESGDHVTVLGWESVTARDTGVKFESEWVHVFTVRDGRVARWRGLYNTAARTRSS